MTQFSDSHRTQPIAPGSMQMMNRREVRKKDPNNVSWSPDGLLWVANPIDYPMRSRGFTNHSAAMVYAHQAASESRPVYLDILRGIHD